MSLGKGRNVMKVSEEDCQKGRWNGLRGISRRESPSRSFHFYKFFYKRGVTPYPMEEARICTAGQTKKKPQKSQRADIANSEDVVNYISSEFDVINVFNHLDKVGFMTLGQEF